MPQVLKDEVERRIRQAALAVFAQRGYGDAGMAEIARQAGLSPGNIYRYFPGKEALFAAVVPESLVEHFRVLLRERLAAARGLEDLRLTAGDGRYAQAAQATADFVLDHRLEVIVLLGQPADTPYSGFPEEVAQLLIEAALSRLEARSPGRALTPALRFDLEEIYRCYVWVWVRILETFHESDAIRRALAAYERYHVAGLREFLA